MVDVLVTVLDDVRLPAGPDQDAGGEDRLQRPPGWSPPFPGGSVEVLVPALDDVGCAVLTDDGHLMVDHRPRGAWQPIGRLRDRLGRRLDGEQAGDDIDESGVVAAEVVVIHPHGVACRKRGQRAGQRVLGGHRGAVDEDRDDDDVVLQTFLDLGADVVVGRRVGGARQAARDDPVGSDQTSINGAVLDRRLDGDAEVPAGRIDLRRGRRATHQAASPASRRSGRRRGGCRTGGS